MLYIAAACKWLCSGHGPHARCGWPPWYFQVSKSHRDPLALLVSPMNSWYVDIFYCMFWSYNILQHLIIFYNTLSHLITYTRYLKNLDPRSLPKWRHRPSSPEERRRPGHVDVLFGDSTPLNVHLGMFALGLLPWRLVDLSIVFCFCFYVCFFFFFFFFLWSTAATAYNGMAAPSPKKRSLCWELTKLDKSRLKGVLGATEMIQSIGKRLKRLKAKLATSIWQLFFWSDTWAGRSVETSKARFFEIV